MSINIQDVHIGDNAHQIVVETRAAWQAQIGPMAEEQGSIVFRRSLYICENLEAGDILTSKNLRAIRPGYGLPPKYINQLLGKKVSRDTKKGTPVSWEFIG